MDYKLCTRCKEEFPATAEFFHKNNRGISGLTSECKTCRNRIARENRLSCNTKKIGRPAGFIMSEWSKNRIKSWRTGKRHTEETKDKISNSVKIYFRNKYTISDELSERYEDIDNDWLDNIGDKLNNDLNIMTEKMLTNKNWTEVPYGENIELFGHNETPELLLLYKEATIVL